MKKIRLLLLMIVIAKFCIAQQDTERLYGTWEETHRDYVFFKNNMMYNFKESEKKAYSGQKIVFTRDTVFAYLTYFSQTLTTPVRYESKTVKIDTLEDEGNFKSLLQKKGDFFQEYKIKEIPNVLKKKYFEEYSIYLFNDTTIGILSDFSFHYLKKVNISNSGFWQKNKYGQAIIKGNYSESISIPTEKTKTKIFITYIPNQEGENFIHIESDEGTYADKWQTLCKKKDSLDHQSVVFCYKIDSTWENIRLFIGGSIKPLDDPWEIRYKFVDQVGKIKVAKATIFSTPNTPTKTYLIKDDAIEVLEIKENWVKIRYYGFKTVEGWIKKIDVE